MKYTLEAAFIFILSINYGYLSTNYYESKITLYPAGELSNSSEIFSDFSDLIESLGINDLSPENNFYIPSKKPSHANKNIGSTFC